MMTLFHSVPILVFCCTVFFVAGKANAYSLQHSSNHSEQRIWWEYPIAEATGGYDAKDNRTLLNTFDIVAWGPQDVKMEVRSFVKKCVLDSGVSALHAFQAAPSPEPAARIAAAWGAFHATLPVCLSARGLANAYVSKFELGYVQRGIWVDGLQLKFTAIDPTADLYDAMHKQIRTHLPDSINRVIDFYVASQRPPKIDINLNPPAGFRHVLAQFPDPSQLRHYVDDAQAQAKKRGKELVSAVIVEAQTDVTNLGKQTITSGARFTIVQIQLVGSAAKTAIATSPQFANALLPKVNSNWSVSVPLLPGVPGGPTVTTPKPSDMVPTQDHGHTTVPIFPGLPGGPKVTF